MELTYSVKRSAKRKKVTITVERDRSVVVHAPQGVSDEKIEQIVQAKRSWIYEKVHHDQKYQNRPHPPGKEMVSGESAMYLGRSYRIEIAESGIDGVRFSRGFVISRSQVAKRKQVLREWYFERARQKILPRVKIHAEQLGVRYNGSKIVDNKYRWGSCTVNDSLNINWRLIKAPMFVIDYVVVHELTHLLEANHTQAFWGIVRAHAPMAEKAKSWLREHGQVLEEEI